MSTTLTTADAVLQNVYLPGIRNFVNTNRPVFQRIQKITDKENFVGRKFIFAGKSANPQGIGARAEGGTLPVAGNTSLLNMELATKFHYAVAKLSAQSMSQTESNRGAFARLIDLEMMGCRDQLEEDLALNAIYGTGDGEFGRIASGGISGTNITMEVSPTVVGATGTRFLRAGMAFESYTALTGGSLGGSGLSVSSITSSSVFVASANTGLSTGDYIFRDVTRGQTVQGLGACIDDGTRKSTFQNLSRTTYPTLKANVLGNSGTLRAWTPELMDQVTTEAWNNGGGKYPSAIYSRLEIQQRAAAYIRQDRRADMATMQLDNGYKTVSWTCPDGQKPWIADQFIRSNEVWAVLEDDLFWALDEDVQWEKRDGAIWRPVDRTHQFEAWLYTFRNLGARQCNNHTALKDVSHTL